MSLIKTFVCMLFTALVTVLLFQSNTKGIQQINMKGTGTIDKEGGMFIPIGIAAKLTHNFQKAYPNSDFPFAEKFNAKLIMRLLQQPGASGLKIYLAKDVNDYIKNIKRKNKIYNNKKIVMILVAVDKNGHDITSGSSNGKLKSQDPSFIMVNYSFYNDDNALEFGQQCPDMCDIRSSLN